MKSFRKYKSPPAGASPSPVSDAVSHSMRSNKRMGTTPELILARLLRKRITRSNLPGSPDFVYNKEKLAVFVHGDWWHSCPVCKPALPKHHRKFWKRKFERNVERDRLDKEELEALGWRVLVVWGHEIKQNPQAVALKIRGLVATPATDDASVYPLIRESGV